MLLLGSSVLLAVSYLLFPLAEGSIGNIVQKASASILLALLAFRTLEDTHVKKRLTLALLLSALGDIFLAIRHDDYFTHGLGAFLIAHLVYISIFARQLSDRPRKPALSIICAMVVLFAGLMMVLLWPELGPLKAPVFLYIIVISAMAIMAVLSAFPTVMVSLGAISFLISDATIAINKFLIPFQMAGSLIWITYIAAQILLTLSIISGSSTKNAGRMPAS